MTNVLARFGLAALAAGFVVNSASAQQDVQITSEAITRACIDIHHSPNAQADEPTLVGPQGITLNCRLIGGNGGFTLAQLTPAEVCLRLTGSTGWYRGAGTEVLCRAGGAAEALAEPSTGSGLIAAEDIARACQRTHRNPQATAAPTTVGPYGLELNCRLVNQNGVTMARVSPEEVCELKYGVRGFVRVAGSTNFLCQRTPVALGQPESLPNKPPQGGGGGGGGKGPAGARNDVRMTPDEIAEGCRALNGAGAKAGPLTFKQWEPVFECSADGKAATYTAALFCPKVSGTGDWYMSPQGAVCRGKGLREYEALANVAVYCARKGHRFGNNGILAQKPPACFDTPGAPINIAIADVCRGLYGSTAFVTRSPVHWCVAEAPAR